MQLTLEWSGYYGLNVPNILSKASHRGGVYKIAVKNPKGEYRPIYVGQSKELAKRLGQYANHDTDNGCLLNFLLKNVCYFNVAEVLGERDRDACEKALYDFYTPLCNDRDKIPDAYRLDINNN